MRGFFYGGGLPDGENANEHRNELGSNSIALEFFFFFFFGGVVYQIENPSWTGAGEFFQKDVKPGRGGNMNGVEAIVLKGGVAG